MGAGVSSYSAGGEVGNMCVSCVCESVCFPRSDFLLTSHNCQWQPSEINSMTSAHFLKSNSYNTHPGFTWSPVYFSSSSDGEPEAQISVAPDLWFLSGTADVRGRQC